MNYKICKDTILLFENSVLFPNEEICNLDLSLRLVKPILKYFGLFKIHISAERKKKIWLFIK